MGRIGTTIVGAVVGAVVGWFSGGPVGAVKGAMWGATIGGGIGSALFPSSAETKPPEIGSLSLQTSEYGQTIPYLQGTRQLSGNCIGYWNFMAVPQEQSGGKGGQSVVTGYAYYVSLAFGLCLKPGNGSVFLQRMWKGKKECNLSIWFENDFIRFYDGTQTTADTYWSFWVKRNPVYKGLAYVIFPNLYLGNSSYVPQFRFEVGTATYSKTDVFIEDVTLVNGEVTTPDGEVGKRMAVDSDTNRIVVAEMLWGYNDGWDNSYVATRLSTDFGETWSDPQAVVTDATSEWIMPDLQFDNGYFWLAVYRFEDWIKLWKSEDGVTWTLVNTIDIAALIGTVYSSYGPDADELSFSVAGDHVVIAFDGTPLSIFYSSDGGSTFNRTDIGVQYPSYPQYYSYSVVKARSDGTVIVITYYEPSAASGDSNYVVLRSTNGGASFVKVHDFSPWLVSNYFDDNFQIDNDGDTWVATAKWLSVKRCDHSDTGTSVENGESFAVLVSKDNGVTWAAQATPAKYIYNEIYYSGYCTPAVAVRDGLIFYTIYYSQVSTVTYQTKSKHQVMWVLQDGQWSLIMDHKGYWSYYASLTGVLRGYRDSNGDIRAVFYGGKVAQKDEAITDAMECYAIIYAPDVLPTTITEDILTNDWYGMGLDSSVLDAAAYADTAADCKAHDRKLSVLINQQVSILDVLQHVIDHHNGFITYADGKIAHRQLKQETPIAALTNSDLVQKDAEPPVSLTKAGGRDYYNKVQIEWTKRDKDYVSGIATAKDDVDIADYGVLDTTIKLDALCTFTRASRMAHMMLVRSLSNPQSLAFELGPKNSDLRPGDVVTITDAHTELDALPIRIGSVSEGEDYIIEVTAAEEITSDIAYNGMVDSSDTDEDSDDLDDLDEDAGRVYQPLILEPCPLFSSVSGLVFSYCSSGFLSWTGASLYRAYSTGGAYTKVADAQPEGCTGRLYSRDETSITVNLYNDVTLESVTNLNDLIVDPTRNLFVLKYDGQADLYCKFMTAELTATRTWKLSGLITNINGVPRVGATFNGSGGAKYAIPYGYDTYFSRVLFYSHLPHKYLCSEDDKFKTLCFKLASVNNLGEEQSLADCSELSEYVDDLTNKPVKPQNVAVNGIGLPRGVDNYYREDYAGTIPASADVVFAWVSSNRYGTGRSNPTRSDAVTEDAEFSQFKIEIYKNWNTYSQSGTLVRTETTTSKTFTYDTTMQTADSFLTGQLVAKIYQQNTLTDSEAMKVTVNRV
ncbi:MAG: phage tail protein [Geobacteraceae bacterium]|nr:phage tail protein [Geobacteraceae bacterium]